MAKRGKAKSKPVNSFIQNWMDQNGYTSVNDAAKKTGISQSILDRLADPGSEHQTFVYILNLADRMNVPVSDLLTGVLEGTHATDEDKLAS